MTDDGAPFLRPRHLPTASWLATRGDGPGRQRELPANGKKNQVPRIDQCVFLGWTLRRVEIRWSDAAITGFKHSL